ncbi:MAG: hypothetical protein IPN68_13915 [Bacteroidetes bacterium]|nr:hypothetical protein [Bacteroidota bacterium]
MKFQENIGILSPSGEMSRSDRGAFPCSTKYHNIFHWEMSRSDRGASSCSTKYHNIFNWGDVAQRQRGIFVLYKIS